MTRIFISYRRKDSEGYAGRLYDSLLHKYEKDEIFFDFESLEKGNYTQVIEDTIASCQFFLEVIGPNWLDIRDEGGKRRLDNPDDLLRREIAIALEKKIEVIPVLVQGAKMPKTSDLPDNIAGLTKKHARTLNPNSFAYDVDQLIEAMGGAYGTIILTPTFGDNFYSTNFWPKILEFIVTIDDQKYSFKTGISGIRTGRMDAKDLRASVQRAFDRAKGESSAKPSDSGSYMQQKVKAEMERFYHQYIVMSQKIKEGTHRISMEGVSSPPTNIGSIKLSGKSYRSNYLSVNLRGGQEMWFSYEFKQEQLGTGLLTAGIILKHYQPVVTE